MMEQRQQQHLYALDFDGVLCDSCNEASIAGLEASKRRWPQIFETVDADAEHWILERMRIVRPVVETGDDFLLLVRVLLEMKNPRSDGSSVLNKLKDENEILERWENLKPTLLDELDESKEELENFLATARDDWISSDLHGWLKATRFYPGISDAIKFSSSKIYIVTTKEARFVAMALKELGGVDFPLEQIYGQGSGPKVDVLKQLQNRQEHHGMILHFVEDRLKTLFNVIKNQGLDNWNLYLASWGYNTPKEREAAMPIDRINVVDLSDFCSKLK